MHRRHFLAAAASAAAVAPAFGAKRIDRSRISAITDEIAKSPADAIQFAQQYGLKWLELRSVPFAPPAPGVRGPGEYFQLPVDTLKQAAKEFRDAGIRISFLNTSLLKYGMPDVQHASERVKSSPRFEKRDDELKKAIEAAHLLGTDKVRVFTFMRAAEPGKVMGRVTDILNSHAEIAAREKILLLIENEGSCNIATAEELAALLKSVPSKWIGINWDPLNAAHKKEIAFPDGYELLPAKRIRNVQIKGHSVLQGDPELMDWTAIFRRLEKDGYRDQIGLETHIFGEVQVQKSHDSIREILRLLGEPVNISKAG
jgi:L-ribulose-5-phosphate 3-epimerase